MCRLICAFVVRIWHKTHFLMAWPICITPLLVFISTTWAAQKVPTFEMGYFHNYINGYDICPPPPPPGLKIEWMGEGIVVQISCKKSAVCPYSYWLCCGKTFEPPHDKTNKMTEHPAKTQISLGIHPVWSDSSLCAQWVAKDPSFLHADSEDSDQTGQMPRLIWVFAGRACHFVGFVMRRLILSESFLPAVALMTVSNWSAHMYLIWKTN